MTLSRRRTLALGCLLLALLVVPGTAHLSSLELDASTRALLAGDERNAASYRQLQGHLGGRELVAFLVAHDDLFSDHGMLAVRRLTAGLARVDGVRDVQSITRFLRPVLRGLSFDPSRMIAWELLVPPGAQPPSTWRAVERLALEDPLARDLLVSGDGRLALVLGVVTRPLASHGAKVALRDELHAVAEPVRALPGVDAVHVLGFPFIEAEMRDAVQRDLLDFAWAALALTLVILLATYRSVTLVVWMLVLEASGLLVLPLLLAWDGTPVNLFNSMLFPLAAGLQLTFLAHLFSALQRALRQGRTFAVALRRALGQVTLPSAVAALTTALGMLALLACDVDAVSAFGRLGAQAVVGVFAVTFVPAWLLAVVLGRGVLGAEPGDAVDDGTVPRESRWMRLTTFLARRRGAVRAAALALLAVCVPALLSLRADVRAVEFLGRHSTARHALSLLDTHLGGLNVLQLEVDAGEPGALLRPDTLRYLESVRAFALRQPGVTNVYSYSLLFCLLNRLWLRDAPGSLRLPDDPLLTGVFALALARHEFPLDDLLRDREMRRSPVVLRTRDMPSRDYLALVQRVLAFAESARPPGVALYSKDGMHSLLAGDRRILAGQTSSLLAGAAAVLAVLWTIWRSLRLALVALLANVPAVAVILALFGYADLPLNSITVMVGSIVLGIAVDDSIHLLTAYRAGRKADRSHEQAMADALAAKLAPMTATSAILCSGLLLLSLSSFPPVVHFGLAAALSLLTALLSAVFLVPALLAPGRRASRG